MQAWGPIGWVSAALIGASFSALSLASLYALLGVGKSRRAMANFQATLATKPHSVNPLDQMFTRQIIQVSDLKISWHPYVFPQQGKVFTECLLKGPGTIMLVECAGNLRDYPWTNFAWYNERGFVMPDIVLRRCVFVDCRFLNLTVFVSRSEEETFRQRFPGLLWTDEISEQAKADIVPEVSVASEQPVNPTAPMSDTPSP